MRQAPKTKPHTALTPYSIGVKLKTLRTEKGLTLSRLGAEVGLSTALLSKLESELMIPTLPTLAKIAHCYGVDLAFFFSQYRRAPLPNCDIVSSCADFMLYSGLPRKP